MKYTRRSPEARGLANILLTARWPVGGIRSYFRYVYGCEVFRNCRFTLLCPSAVVDKTLEKEFPTGAFEVVGVKGNLTNLGREIRRAARSGAFDLVHSHGCGSGVVSSIALLGQAIPHLVTAHDVFQEGQFYGLRGKLKREIMGKALARCDRVLAVSDDCRQNTLEYLSALPAQNVVTIRNGIDTDAYRHQEKCGLRRDLGLDASEYLVGFFGRFMSQKGFRSLIEAMAILRERAELRCQPRVVAFGWGEFIREDQAYMSQRGLESYFLFQPFATNMNAVLRSVDLVVMPSLWEACGLLAMETLCAGTPLISSDCIGKRARIPRRHH